MGQFSFVQNEHCGVGDNIVASGLINGCSQRKATNNWRHPAAFRSWETGRIWHPQPRRQRADTGFDTISVYLEECGGRRFAGVARTKKHARPVGDLPLLTADKRQDEPLRGEEWTVGRVWTSSKEVRADFDGLGGTDGGPGGGV